MRTSAFAVVVALLSGCSTVPLYADPTSNDEKKGLPTELYQVDWSIPLVEWKMWDYVPREFAGPSMDLDTGRLITLTRDGYIRSINPDAKVEWQFKTSLPFNAPALVREGVAYVSGGDGYLYALNARTLKKDGEVLWKYKAGEELVTQPVYSNGTLFVMSQSDTLYAVDAKTGKWEWQNRRDQPSGYTVRGAGAPTVTMGVVYQGFSDGTVAALDAKDGTVKWERSLAAPGAEFVDVDTQPVVDDSGSVFVASYKDGVYALNGDTGDIQWHTVAHGLTGLIGQGDVLFGTGDGSVVALHARTGQTLWTLDIGETYGRTPTLVKGLLVVPTNKALLFVDPSTGRPRVSWDPGKGISATPLWAEQRLFVLSNLGHLYALELYGRRG